jgi:hypothetical protein
MKIKVTTWNIEHLEKAINGRNSADNKRRLQLIAEEIKAIEPDILAIQEGPKGEGNIKLFSNEYLGNYLEPVTLPGNTAAAKQPKAYKINGTQWMWFLVKPVLKGQVRLQSPEIYQSFTKQTKWKVHYWGKYLPQEHFHYRHPQVLIFKQDNEEIEFINVHLKSMINQLPVNAKPDGTPSDQYVDEALKARVKMTTEAIDVRKYISAKFAQKPNPGIVVLGDCNQSPGKDFFEEYYLFFDLIINTMQGDVMSAEEFFNHALFDYKTSLRWTVRYDDPVTHKKAADNPLLIDHILFSQPLVNGSLPLKVNENAGLVEHEIHERTNAQATKRTYTSDHCPASCYFDIK